MKLKYQKTQNKHTLELIWHLVYLLIMDKNLEKCEPVFTNTNHGFIMKDRNFTYAGNGYIQDNNFDHDAALKISGDFVEGDLDKYAQMIVKQLNTKG